MAALRSRDLARMSPPEAEAAIAKLAQCVGEPNPAFDARVRARIRDFEIRYEVTSAEMLEELRDGRRKETAEIAEWLFWLSVLNGQAAGQA
jgi:hypothetical protein